MAYPPPYSPSTNFTELAASLGIPRDRLDVEFMNIAQFCAGILKNIQGVQRSDGALANGVVTLDSLSPGVKTAISGGWTPKGQWIGPGVKYEEGDYVEVDGLGYVAVVDHISSNDFALDSTAGYWQTGFALTILQTEPEINVYAATGGQTDFPLNSPIGSSDAILVYVNSFLTADFTTSGNSVVLDTPASTADEIVIVHFRVVDQSLVNTLFTARDEAVASAASALADAAIATAQATAAAASATSATADAALAAAERALAEASEVAAAASATASANSAAVSTSESINASLAEDNVVRRILPGRYASFAAAAASPYADDGAMFVYSVDGGVYYFNTVTPLDVRALPNLTAQQAANIAAIAAMKAALNLFDGTAASGGVADAYTVTSLAGQELGAYYDGLRVAFIVAADNTGAATIAIDGLAATALEKYDGVALKAGDLAAGMAVEAVYDSGAFNLVSPTANTNLKALAGLAAASGNFPYFTGSQSMGLAALSTIGRNLLAEDTQAGMQGVLGLGLMALANVVTPSDFSGVMPESKGGTGASSVVSAMNAIAGLRVVSATLNQTAGHIQLQWGGSSLRLAFAWGRANVGGNTASPVAMTQNFTSVFVSQASIIGNNDVEEEDHVYADHAGGNVVTLTNGVNSARTLNYWVVGLPL